MVVFESELDNLLMIVTYFRQYCLGDIAFFPLIQGISGCTSLKVLDVAGNPLSLFPTDVCCYDG